MCTVLLPLGVNPIEVNKYINISIDIVLESYHLIGCSLWSSSFGFLPPPQNNPKPSVYFFVFHGYHLPRQSHSPLPCRSKKFAEE